MKHLALILFVFLLIKPIFGQENFIVPSMTDTTKHQRVVFVMNYVMIASANYAKQQGQSIEDYAKSLGDLAKTTWNKEAGFDGFVKGTLYNWESWRVSYSPYIKIITQSEGYIQFKVPLEFNKWFEDGNIHDLSFINLMEIYAIMHKTIAEYLGASYEQELIEDGNWIEITIKEK